MEIKFEPLYVIDETSERVDAKTGEINYVGSFEIVNTPRREEESKIIAYVHPYGLKKWPNKDEAESYARLFAAAPELLDAANNLIADLTGGDYPEWPNSVNILQNIIDKIKANG